MSPTETALPKPATLDEVPGWFHRLDQQLFAFFLEATAERGGDILEMGCYLGKSTIVMGRHVQEGESFTVCDLFGDESQGTYSREETRDFYQKTLSLRAFENNYLAFHDELPTIVQGRTNVLADAIPADSCRFIHIDASHMYEDVTVDIDTTRKILRPYGVVSLDDYRTEHTPGVSAAVWEAVFTKGMRPVCVSGSKMYATWGETADLQERLRAWAEGVPTCTVSEDLIDGEVVLRLTAKKPKPAPKPAAEPAAKAIPAQSAPAAAARPAKRPLGRRIAVNLLPPVITRAVRRVKRG
ncbi:class I SAM-dependent methyltransferase [Streptomyces luteocolor]|uniref:class I SAM-dependent methyltransferase n=1 Tax=Streptomyces luteocolor TaxID=285500 RepID=UPI000852979F|nr:class I SAM-dependent methyltransferase [Streptomyces luteocolor]